MVMTSRFHFGACGKSHHLPEMLHLRAFGHGLARVTRNHADVLRKLVSKTSAIKRKEVAGHAPLLQAFVLPCEAADALPTSQMSPVVRSEVSCVSLWWAPTKMCWAASVPTKIV